MNELDESINTRQVRKVWVLNRPQWIEYNSNEIRLAPLPAIGQGCAPRPEVSPIIGRSTLYVSTIFLGRAEGKRASP